MATSPPDNARVTRRSTIDTAKDELLASPECSPSYTQSSSTLTSAESTSNSSTSPPGPMTPPTRTDRCRSRYGELGRVPLHRRGTSKTYERLEDLLKEAGYKETRVFTPEAERLEAAADDDPKADDNRLTGVGAVVVDFLANLFPGPGRHSRQASNAQEEDPEYSPPPSPLGERRSMRSPVTPGNLTSSMDSLDDTPKATRQVSEARSRIDRASDVSSRPSQASLHHSRYDLSSRPSEASLHRPPTLVHPRPSRARAYLRHMASTASIQPPERPNSTPVHIRSAFSMRANTREKGSDDPSILFSKKGNGEGEEDHRGQPPLPSTWLETVARAVLTSGSGVVGGPKQPTLRPARSSLSQKQQPSKRRAGLSDQTNLPPPPLLTMLERGRAGRSESEVTRTRVVCRSAPGSRASSLVRGGPEKSRTERGRGDKRRKGEKDRLPSLARTQTEGDPWNHGRGKSVGMTANQVKNLYLSGRGVGRSSMFDDEREHDGDDDAGLSDSDEEGELDLARILVHPKRQQSVRSLRKHLHQAPDRPLSPMRRMGRGHSGNYVKSPLSEDDDWGQENGWVRRAGCGDEDDDAASFALAFGDFQRASTSTKRSRPRFTTWGGRD